MTIAPALLREYPAMNEAQRAVVTHDDRPLLVIAGPGSGKTFSLVLRAINLLLLNKATPRELVICTFTEKAAFELRDRIAAAARKVGYTGDLSELRVGTIQGISAFCPRARACFDNDEVRLMIGCLVVIFGYYGEGTIKLREGDL